MKQKKKFDVLEWKDKVQRKIYEEIKDMTWEEEIEYFKKSVENGPFADLLKKIKAHQKKSEKKKAG